MSIGLAISLVTSQSLAESTAGLWILAFNSWNDAGVWLDNEFWND